MPGANARTWEKKRGIVRRVGNTDQRLGYMPASLLIFVMAIGYDSVANRDRCERRLTCNDSTADTTSIFSVIGNDVSMPGMESVMLA